ncbi:S-methyl-5-thioribose-1-phosphate isomerase [candidate division KSB3 bacterium]|uniref:Methylthioribose-1-phosphate isomerase n=1 Tax=candidate division KSB3 bacterium TaxID=2044937 RepID=A0A2G6E754_9BACT|nr:MAG: S-methyl-5-thioribose-1-phosphate isomerase [candidate division KSB3 bacterium]PIE30309.1 MAG: S-methyl-5-thioribose-1-phosphate isomerase [candidate division KSB3 bacterium]
MQEFLKHIEWKDGVLHVLNQIKLPAVTEYNPKSTVEDVFHAIQDMELRGAPLIGIAAGYGMYIAIKDLDEMPHDAFMSTLRKNGEYLAKSRPTAVNLFWAIDRMIAKVDPLHDKSVAEKQRILGQEALNIHEEDRRINRKIGENLLSLLDDGMTILTHCNAGILATGYYGTATSPIYLAQEKGWNLQVYADETRPYLQGARLTSYELHESGIDVTLICDNMAGVVMSQGKIDAVITGTDRVAANGDVANKIGTMSVAILARHFGIPVYIAAPTPTIDMNCPSGRDIPIEERAREEITHWYGHQIAPKGVKVFNPAFDVTPNEFVTAIVTERGIVKAPYTENLKSVLA